MTRKKFEIDQEVRDLAHLMQVQASRITNLEVYLTDKEECVEAPHPDRQLLRIGRIRILRSSK